MRYTFNSRNRDLQFYSVSIIGIIKGAEYELQLYSWEVASGSDGSGPEAIFIGTFGTGVEFEIDQLFQKSDGSALDSCTLYYEINDDGNSLSGYLWNMAQDCVCLGYNHTLVHS